MASPTVNGGTFYPDPPQPNQPFQLKTNVTDADVGAARSGLVVKAQDPSTGVMYEGTLLTQDDVLTVDAAPADTSSPAVARDQADDQLFHGVAPASFTKLSYAINARDASGNTDSRVVNTLDYVPPAPNPGPGPGPTPGATSFRLDLSRTAINPATGLDQIVIGGGFAPPGLNSTIFGSNDIDAIDYQGKRRVRIHFDRLSTAMNPDVNRSINLVPNLLLYPADTFHINGTWMFETPDEAISMMRKWIYLLRADAATNFVLTTRGSGPGTLGKMDFTTHRAAWYSDPSKTKMEVFVIAPPSVFAYRRDINIDVLCKINSVNGVADGALQVKIDDKETFNNPSMITVQSAAADVAGSPIKQMSLHKFGQQAQANNDQHGQTFDEYRYISDLLFEKL